MTTTPAPVEGRRARPRARRALLPEAETTGLITRDRFCAEHGITRHTLRLWIGNGLPFVKIGGLIYFRVTAVRAWVAAQERTTGGGDAAA
jgi:hypothetical protein